MGEPILQISPLVEVGDYRTLAGYIFKNILENKPCCGSKNIPPIIWKGILIQADVSCHEEDFEHFQVDQLRLNHIFITDEYGFSLDCEEEIGDMIDELISDYNQEQVTEVERDYEFSY